LQIDDGRSNDSSMRARRPGSSGSPRPSRSHRGHVSEASGVSPEHWRSRLGIGFRALEDDPEERGRGFSSARFFAHVGSLTYFGADGCGSNDAVIAEAQSGVIRERSRASITRIVGLTPKRVQRALDAWDEATVPGRETGFTGYLVIAVMITVAGVVAESWWFAVVGVLMIGV